MKQKNRKTIRRWISILLTCSIIFSMASVSLADEPGITVPSHQNFSGGETEQITLGDLVLTSESQPYDPENPNYVLDLEFADGDGGGNVTVQTGDITAASDHMEIPVGGGFYEWCDVGGAVNIDMHDASTLTMDTGNISSATDGFTIDANESSRLEVTVDGNITTAEDAVTIHSTDNSSVKITAEDIISENHGIGIHSRDNSDTEVTVNSIDTAGSTISIGGDYDCDVKMKVDGDVTGGQGVSITNHYNSDVKLETGNIITDYLGVGTYLYDYSDANITVNGDIATGSGQGIFSQTDDGSTVKVDVTGSVSTEDGYGLDLVLGGFDSGEPQCKADITIGGSLTSSDQAVYVHNNVDGHVTINIGTDETIENAGTITAADAGAIFVNTLAGSSVEINGGDVYGAGDSQNIRLNAEGDNSSIKIDVGNVTVTENGSADGISATAGHSGSQVTIDAGDVTAANYGVIVDTDSRYDYGNPEDGSVYGSGGTLTVNVGSVTAGSGGISSSADGGTLVINSGSVEAGENGYGVSVWTSGDEADGGVTVTVDGTVTAGETGISVGSSEADRYLYYENNWNIQVNPDDPHENWWEKMRIDETGYYVLVPVDTENGIEWQKYLWYPEGHPQHEDYSEEDISNYQVFDDVFGWVDFEDVSITTESANYTNISTGAVTAGDTGIQANNNGGDFDIQVNGGVTVEGPEYDVYVDDWDGTTYVYYNDADGITATNTAGTTSIAVNGDLSVSCITDGNDAPVGEGANQGRYNGNGVTIGNYGGEINIDITGDVNTESGTAVSIEPRFDYYDWEFEDLNGDAVVNIGGDVTAENGVNVGANSGGTGHTTISIGGNLTTTGSGLVIGQEVPVNPWAETEDDESDESLEGNGTEDGENTAAGTEPTVDIIVQETISGLTPILVSNMEAVTNVLITTWAVKPNENNHITEDENGNPVTELEENINYIIKKEDNEYGTLTVSGTSAKITPDDTELAVATQDTSLSLTVSLVEQYSQGYDVIIYNGTGENKLEADVTHEENGTFTFLVPWAGGVYLTFGVVSNGQTTPDPDPVEPDPDEPDPDEPDPDEPDPDEPDPDEPEPDEPDPDEPDPDEPDPDEPEPDEPEPDEPEPDEPEPDEPEPDEPEPDEPDEPESEATDPAAIIADADVSDAGNGRVLAILYGEKTDGIEEDYIIWFLSGYGYRAKFRDGYTEYGTYRVKDDELTLTARDGSERTVTDRVIAFDEERKAEIVKTDFSDSARIIGEFNVNDEDILEITDRELKALSLPTIHETIDNPYAWEILTAILTEKAE